MRYDLEGDLMRGDFDLQGVHCSMFLRNKRTLCASSQCRWGRIRIAHASFAKVVLEPLDEPHTQSPSSLGDCERHAEIV